MNQTFDKIHEQTEQNTSGNFTKSLEEKITKEISSKISELTKFKWYIVNIVVNNIVWTACWRGGAAIMKYEWKA